MTLSCNTNEFANPWDALHSFKEAFPKLVRAIRKRFGAFEYVAVYERHQNGFPHLHVAYRGSFIPQKWLSKHWNEYALSPIVDIRVIPNQRALSRYLVKYLVKNASQTAAAFPRLRVITTSRHYLPKQFKTTEPGPYEGWTWIRLMNTPGNVADLLLVTARCPETHHEPDHAFSFAVPENLPPPPDNDPETLRLWAFLKGDQPCESMNASTSK